MADSDRLIELTIYERSADNPLWSINRRLDTLESRVEIILHRLSLVLSMLQSLTKLEKREMATLAEVQAAVEAARAEAAADADVGRSAIALIRRILAMIGDAAANAADLDGLKASLESITTTVHANAQDLGDAVAAAPSAP